EAQELELADGKRDRPAVHAYLMPACVHHEAPEVQYTRVHTGGPTARAAQHGFDAGHHLGGGRGLDDVVVAAPDQAANLIRRGVAGAEEEDGDVGGLADTPGELKAREAGHHDVQQQAV